MLHAITVFCHVSYDDPGCPCTYVNAGMLIQACYSIPAQRGLAFSSHCMVYDYSL